jgi:hypothetical protein
MFNIKISQALTVAILALVAIEANAAVGRGNNDGCAVLGQLVSSQLDALSAGLFGTRLRGDTGESVAMPDAPGYCASTAATVSRAFGSAMHNAGIVVSWRASPLIPVDYCLDRYLPHCNPIIGPPDGSVTAQERRFVHDAWKAISRGVAGAMPYGVGSDMAVFDELALKSSLAINLRYELSVEKNAPGRATR